MDEVRFNPNDPSFSSRTFPVVPSDECYMFRPQLRQDFHRFKMRLILKKKQNISSKKWHFEGLISPFVMVVKSVVHMEGRSADESIRSSADERLPHGAVVPASLPAIDSGLISWLDSPSAPIFHQKLLSALPTTAWCLFLVSWCSVNRRAGEGGVGVWMRSPKNNREVTRRLRPSMQAVGWKRCCTHCLPAAASPTQLNSS